MYELTSTSLLLGLRRNAKSRLRRIGIRVRGERGSALVEFALVLPMFLLLTTGTFSFGIALNNYLELTNATASGAQLVAVSRGSKTNTDPCAAGVTAIENAAPYLNPTNIQYTMTFMGTTGTTTNSYGPTAGALSCPGASSSTTMVQGGSVQVIATYPCTLAVYGAKFGCYLHAQVTEMVQ
ncbi:MAG: TadE family protein [Silvibacterium sp.]